MKRPRTQIPGAAMLTHFTRTSKTVVALDNLISILSDGAIRGSKRMIAGGREAVCMFDLPLPDLRLVLDPQNRRRYQPFGIAIDKHYAFKMGARPVTYIPWNEAERIFDPAEYWRVARLEIGRNPPVDWSYEREWRVPGDLELLPRSSVVLVESWSDADEIYDRFGGKPPCAGVIPLKELFGAG